MSNFILDGSATSCSGLLSMSVSESHSAATSSAVVSCREFTGDLGDLITVNLGYTTNKPVVFKGYVKLIERRIPENVYTITLNDVMIRAVDFFIASSNPEQPFKRRRIKAETFVRDLMALAGLTNYDGDNSHFTLAIGVDAEVNLVTAYDYSKSIADIIAWHLYADYDGVVHFMDRKPYPMDGETGDGDQDFTITQDQIIDISELVSEKDVRNRVVVYGPTGIYAEAKRATTLDPRDGAFHQILPSGFYKALVFASPLMSTVAVCQDAADFNLELFNRLNQEVTISILGNPDIHARDIVRITEPILGIDANLYAYQVEHSWSKSGYLTNIVARR